MCVRVLYFNKGTKIRQNGAKFRTASLRIRFCRDRAQFPSGSPAQPLFRRSTASARLPLRTLSPGSRSVPDPAPPEGVRSVPSRIPARCASRHSSARGSGPTGPDRRPVRKAPFGPHSAHATFRLARDAGRAASPSPPVPPRTTDTRSRITGRLCSRPPSVGNRKPELASESPNRIPLPPSAIASIVRKAFVSFRSDVFFPLCRPRTRVTEIRARPRTYTHPVGKTGDSASGSPKIKKFIFCCFDPHSSGLRRSRNRMLTVRKYFGSFTVKPHLTTRTDPPAPWRCTKAGRGFSGFFIYLCPHAVLSKRSDLPSGRFPAAKAS